MKKSIGIWLCIMVLLMVVLPWAGVSFAPPDAGMAVCILHWFVLMPVFSLVLGFYCGGKGWQLWPLPLVSGALFTLGNLFFSSGSWEVVFLIYSLSHLLITYLVMTLRILFRKK